MAYKSLIVEAILEKDMFISSVEAMNMTNKKAVEFAIPKKKTTEEAKRKYLQDGFELSFYYENGKPQWKIPSFNVAAMIKQNINRVLKGKTNADKRNEIPSSFTMATDWIDFGYDGKIKPEEAFLNPEYSKLQIITAAGGKGKIAIVRPYIKAGTKFTMKFFYDEDYCGFQDLIDILTYSGRFGGLCSQRYLYGRFTLTSTKVEDVTF